MFSDDFDIITNNANQQNQLKNKMSPIYYNVSITPSYHQVAQQDINFPAFVSEINNQPIIPRASLWYLSVLRATIPTNYLPILIVPIVADDFQNDINKCIYTITFQYADASNNLLGVPLSFPVKFISELYNVSPVNTGEFAYPLPPSQNGGKQDVSTEYYYVYSPTHLQSFYQSSMITAWEAYCDYINTNFSVVLDKTKYPVITYDIPTQIFSINFYQPYFDESLSTNKTLMFLDSLSINTFNFQSRLIPPFFRTLGAPSPTVPAYNLYQQNYINCFFNGVNKNIHPLLVDYLTMTAPQTNNDMWGGVVKIIFQVSYGISTRLEYDSAPSAFGTQTNQQSAQRPLYQFLTDLEVDRTQFQFHRNFIQFNNGGGITAGRLIELNEGIIQNFDIYVKWVDCFGNIKNISLPDGMPLTMKIGWFPKTTMLI